MKKTTILIIICIFLTACQAENEKTKIGIMTMTTGDVAFLGENIIRSAELALEELGYEDKIEFIIEDAGNLGEGRTTVTSYKKLVEVDKVQFVIDGMSSDGTMSIAHLLDQDKVVMMTPLTGGENIDNAAEYLFRNGPSDILTGTKPAEDMFDMGLIKVALFTDNAEYTLDIRKHFEKKFKGTIVVDEIIEPEKTDYRSEVSKLTGKDFDAIMILTAYGNSAGYIIKRLHEVRNDRPIFGNFLAFTEDSLAIAGKGMENVYIYDPEFDESSELTKEFFVKYKEKYGKDPTIPFHTTGTYDALKMAIEAIEKVGNDGERIRDYLLQNILKWQGMNGETTFDEKGNTQTGFVLKQVKNGMLVHLNQQQS